jgi:membrane protease YdiL (CAAX protease family)
MGEATQPRMRLRKSDVAALLFAMSFPSLMSWIEFWLIPKNETEESALLNKVFGLGKIIQFAFPLVYVAVTAPKDLRPRRPHTHGMILSTAFGFLVAVGACVLYFPFLKDTDVFQDTPAKLAAWLATFHANTPAFFLAMSIFVSVIHSLLEEYYWRWFVFGRLERALPLGAALAISSVAFMAHHVFVLAYYFPGRFWIAAAPFSLCVAAGGFVWGWLYHRYQSVYAPWISHVIADLTFMYIGYDMVSKYW